MELSIRRKPPVLEKERRSDAAPAAPKSRSGSGTFTMRTLMAEINDLNARAKEIAGHLSVEIKKVPKRSAKAESANHRATLAGEATTAAVSRIAELTKELQKQLLLIELPPYSLKEIEAIDARLEQSEQRRERGTRALIRTKQLLPSPEFCRLMGWSKQAQSKALASNRIFFVEEDGTRYFPAFYADRSMERRHLEAVTKLLGDLPGSAKLQFFETGKGSLGGRTPLDALKAGKLAAVKTAAEGFAEK